MFIQSLQVLFALPIAVFGTWLWVSNSNRIKWKWFFIGLAYIATYFLMFHFLLKQF